MAGAARRIASGRSTREFAFPRPPASSPGGAGPFLSSRRLDSTVARSRMKLRSLRLAACSLIAFAAACTQLVRAHEFKLDAVINAFVKIEPGEAQLVVRAPLYLFKSANFPVNNVEIDFDKSNPPIERALAAFP